MIHLDTNYLIELPVKGSTVIHEVEAWLAAGASLATSAIAWTECLHGPVTSLAVTRAEAILQSRIVPFGEAQAALAAELFKQTGRRRGSRFDCLIAATAVLARAEIATLNATDFRMFVPYGLKLAIPLPPPPHV